MNLSQCSLRQPLVFHCSWSPEGHKGWMPLSALGQAPHHSKHQLEKAKKSCEYFVDLQIRWKIFPIIWERWVVWENWNKEVQMEAVTYIYIYYRGLSLSATVIDPPFPHKNHLRYFALPSLKNWSVLTLHMYFTSVCKVTLNLEHISEYLSEKLQKYCKSHMAVFCFLKEI